MQKRENAVTFKGEGKTLVGPQLKPGDKAPDFKCLSGLAAAHRVVETAKPVDVTLLEARPHLGGTVGTEQAGGFLVEQGADSFVTDKPWALALAERLGLGPRLVATNDRFRRVYVVRRGRLYPLP